MSVLSAEGLTGGYAGATVLWDVSVEVASGEALGILGANGAGKTSLLRALSGGLPRCRGRVVVDGERVDGKPPWSRVAAGLSHVPEGRHVFSGMTVQENLEVARNAVRGEKADLGQVYELFPRLHERRQQLSESMSGGEQQMLAVGRALMTRPKVLLIDEMSAGLAPAIVDRLVESLRRIRESGVSLLLVEQSVHFVADLVDRVYLLERGRAVREGTIADLGGAGALAELYLGVG